MLSTQSKKTTNRLALGLASFVTAIALMFAMVFATPTAALAEENLLLNNLQATQVATGEHKAATVLIYLNGSNLESEGGAASADINEMLASGIGKNVNVVIETLGTKEWQEHGIASDHTQRYLVNQGQLELVDDSLGQLDTTSSDTLADFISWGVENYPADRYMLIMWDHGAGPVYGFGQDEFQNEDEALTLDEMRNALEANKDVHFDFIGMDCCIMSSLETYYVFAPYCDYAILSEDFEPGIGWSYENWMSTLEKNPTVHTEDLGTTIVRDMVDTSEEDTENGGDATLALVDESAVPALYEAWIDFAYENENTLLGTNYSQEVTQHGRDGFIIESSESVRPGGHDSCDFDDWSFTTMSDYYVTDIMAAASSANSEKTAALEQALSDAIVYFDSTSGETGMTGIAVTLPYGDAEFYHELADVFTNCDIDADYVAWLENFVNAEGVDNYYDFSDFADEMVFDFFRML